MRIWPPVILLLVSFVAVSCVRDRWHTASGNVWNTVYHATYESDRDLSDSIISITRQIDESLSMFNSASTVSRINRGETDSVDTHFTAVYNLSKRIHEASGGVFDPTVAPLVDLWGFGREGRAGVLPDSAVVARALDLIGIMRSTLRDNHIEKGHPEMEFDFSSIAKGYGVECVADMFRRNGCDNFMIEIGGEIQLAGHNPQGGLWRIQIDAPVADSEPGDSALIVLELTDCALATSGNYRNYRSIGGDSIIGHTIDPRTGYPAQRRVLSATVIAPGCAEADGLATAVMASSPQEAGEILQKFKDCRAILVLPDGTTVYRP